MPMYALFACRWWNKSERPTRKVAVSAALDSRERLRRIDPQILIDRSLRLKSRISLWQRKGKDRILMLGNLGLCS